LTEDRSYAQARKDREKFRQKLVEIIMHRDEWDDEVSGIVLYKVNHPRWMSNSSAGC
jgi:hypothetical protein